MSARLPTEGWTLTLGLSALALVAALLAPRLFGSSAPDADAEAAVAACVRLGPYECCYDPQE